MQTHFRPCLSSSSSQHNNPQLGICVNDDLLGQLCVDQFMSKSTNCNAGQSCCVDATLNSNPDLFPAFPAQNNQPRTTSPRFLRDSPSKQPPTPTIIPTGAETHQFHPSPTATRPLPQPERPPKTNYSKTTARMLSDPIGPGKTWHLRLGSLRFIAMPRPGRFPLTRLLHRPDLLHSRQQRDPKHATSNIPATRPKFTRPITNHLHTLRAGRQNRPIHRHLRRQHSRGQSLYTEDCFSEPKLFPSSILLHRAAKTTSKCPGTQSKLFHLHRGPVRARGHRESGQFFTVQHPESRHAIWHLRARRDGTGSVQWPVCGEERGLRRRYGDVLRGGRHPGVFQRDGGESRESQGRPQAGHHDDSTVDDHEYDASGSAAGSAGVAADFPAVHPDCG